MKGGRIQPLAPLESLKALQARRFPVATTASELYALMAYPNAICRIAKGEYDLGAHQLKITNSVLFADGVVLVLGVEGLELQSGTLNGGIIRCAVPGAKITAESDVSDASRIVGANLLGLPDAEILVVNGNLLMWGCMVGLESRIRVTSNGRLSIVCCKVDLGLITVESGGVLVHAGNFV